MSEMMSNVKTINSSVRTVLMLGVAGVIGFGGWIGYDNYVKPSRDVKQALAQLEEIKADYAKQSALMEEIQATNERLETSMKLLKVDRRIANIKVMEKGKGDDGEPYLEVRFTEIDERGEVVGSPRDFTLKGDKFYIDSWIATFEDKYIEQADELRAATLFSFKSIYGDRERPADGQALDTQTVQNGPPGIYKGERQMAFEQKIWSDFWKVCNDRAMQKELGIRASFGEAPYVFAEEGQTYQVNIRSSGGISLVPIDE